MRFYWYFLIHFLHITITCNRSVHLQYFSSQFICINFACISSYFFIQSTYQVKLICRFLKYTQSGNTYSLHLPQSIFTADFFIIFFPYYSFYFPLPPYSTYTPLFKNGCATSLMSVLSHYSKPLPYVSTMLYPSTSFHSYVAVPYLYVSIFTITRHILLTHS